MTVSSLGRWLERQVRKAVPYAGEQVTDLILWMAIVYAVKGVPTNAQAHLDWLRLGAQWVARHGTPSERRVREYLGV